MINKQTPARTKAVIKNIALFLEGRKSRSREIRATIFDTRAPLERPMRNIVMSKKRAIKWRIFPRHLPLPSKNESIINGKRGIVMVDGKVCSEKNPSILPLMTKDHRVNPPIKITKSTM